MEAMVVAGLRQACLDYACRNVGAEDEFAVANAQLRLMKTRKELLDWLQTREPNVADFARRFCNAMAG